MKNVYGAEQYTKQDNGKLGFDKVELPFYGNVSLANMTQFKIGAFVASNNRLAIGIEGFGFYTFNSNSHPHYVKEKLGLNFLSDARSVADFIEGQFGVHNQYQDNINEHYL